MNEVRNVLIGFELGAQNSQIAYYDRKAKEPVSVPARTGTMYFEFPTRLAKRRGSDEWAAGFDAADPAKAESWVSPGSLTELLTAETVELDGTVYEPWQLLAVFFRESLRLLGLQDLLRSIRGICVTVERLQGEGAVCIRRALEAVGFRREYCFVQDYEESFYYYGYSQKQEVCTRAMALIRFEGDEVSFRRLSEQRTGKPFTASVKLLGNRTLSEEPETRDSEFSAFIEEQTERGGYSGMFITGDGFSPDWAVRSVKVLSARGARVFEGGNLFVKGACWTVLERLERKAFKNRIYLGPDLVRVALGIDIIEGNRQKFFPLIRPGVNWFENVSEVEILPDGRDDLLFTVSSMDGTKHRNYHLLPEGLPERPNRAGRFLLRAECVSLEQCHLRVEDLGFGELFPATHKVWEMDIPLTTEPAAGGEEAAR